MMINLLIFIIYLQISLTRQDSVFDVFNKNNPYCSKKCAISNRTHINCPCDASSLSCKVFFGGYYQENLFRKAVVDIHNALRNKIALGELQGRLEGVAAGNMQYVKYNTELEEIATCRVRNCSNVDNDCQDLLKQAENARSPVRMEETVKTHLVLDGRSQVQFLRTIIVDTWFNEYKKIDTFPEHYTGRTIFNEFREGDKYHQSIKHFLQLAWAKTREVGCSISVDLRSQNTFLPAKAKDTPIFRLCCLYYPGGLENFHSVFITGTPAESCLYQRNPEFHGLCGSDIVNTPKGPVSVPPGAAPLSRGLYPFDGAESSFIKEEILFIELILFIYI